MKFTSAILSAASLVACVNAAPYRDEYEDIAARQVPSKPCSHMTGGVHVIAAPGAGNASPPYGLIGSLATDILNALPGSTNISLPYNHTDTNGLRQTQQGANTLTTYISQYHQSCPNTKIVLLGYSAGAVITMNVLCGESAPYNPQTAPLSNATYGPYVIAAVMYGDESRTANQSYDLGTCTGVGSHPRPNPGGCSAWAPKMQSYCDKDDPLCCATTGTDQADHYVYPGEYDQAAKNFVVAQAMKYGV